ncbi:hypothetical protein Tco_0676327 [Tanacetum coccineum]
MIRLCSSSSSSNPLSPHLKTTNTRISNKSVVTFGMLTGSIHACNVVTVGSGSVVAALADALVMKRSDDDEI